MSTFIGAIHTSLIKFLNFGTYDISEELRSRIQTLELSDTPPSSYIIDLRDNPGGFRDNGIDTADYFLNDGIIQQILTNSGDTRTTGRAKQQTTIVPDKPVVILVNENTASAAEVVAGALQSHKRATIIGSYSFGKGTGQVSSSVHVNGNNFGTIWITNRILLNPEGRSIHNLGITPDILVLNNKEEEIFIERQINLPTTLRNPKPFLFQSPDKICEIFEQSTSIPDDFIDPITGNIDFDLLCAISYLQDNTKSPESYIRFSDYEPITGIE